MNLKTQERVAIGAVGIVMGVMLLMTVALLFGDSSDSTTPVAEEKTKVDYPVIRKDTEVTPTNSWTSTKQAFYLGCVEEAPGYESYCKCAANYVLDTYDADTVRRWGNQNYIPEIVIDTTLDKCM